MNWYSETAEDALARKREWHRWFAWWPVRIGSRVYWLETVLRRYSDDCWLDWEYAPL